MASKKQQKRKVVEEVDESFAPLVLESKPKKGKMNVNANANDNSNDVPVDAGNGSNRMVMIEHCKSW